MILLRRMILGGLFLVYGALFFHHEQIRQHSPPRLTIPLPTSALKTVLGYLRQLGGEMHFVKTAVFLGALDPSKPMDAHADNLVANFNTMVELHPYFRDSYHLAESALAHIGPEQTRAANEILATGIKAYPEEWLLPFFKGFNHFYYLKENREAADDLLKASRLPNGPTWLAHLASMLAAEGGDIYGGLAWLNMMLKTEEDPTMQERYRRAIADFQKALVVQEAVFAYRKKYQRLPSQLNELIPEFLQNLPDFGDKFHLEWQPPNLKLIRPNQKRHSPS